MAEESKKFYPCRICGYDFKGPVRDEHGLPQYDICPACGAEVGNDDEEIEDIRRHREGWLNNGSKWWSKFSSPPEGWDPQEQMKNIPNEWR